MRLGASISGGIHAAFVALAVFGVDWFAETEPLPFTVTEIEMVDGQDFEAALSTAPIVRSEGPADLAPPAEGQSAPEAPDAPQDTAEPAELPTLAENTPPEPQPERPVIQRTPPPAPILTEPELPSIAEMPSPDPLDRQAAAPESPASTEPVMPLQAMTPPTPSAKPTPPPEPEPEPEPEPVVEDPEPQVADAPDPEAIAQPEPEPEPEQRPDPEAVAETQPEAPEGPAPREARLPVAKPAALAAAARAAAEAQAVQQRQEQPQQQNPTPSQQAGGSQSEFTQRLTRGERNALRLGIRKHYYYGGDRSDRNLQVIIRVRLNQDGSINGKPEQRRASGGNPASQRALFNAGRRAILKAAAAGEFRRLPADKYQRWKVLNFRFSVDDVRGTS